MSFSVAVGHSNVFKNGGANNAGVSRNNVRAAINRADGVGSKDFSSSIMFMINNPNTSKLAGAVGVRLNALLGFLDDAMHMLPNGNV